MKKNKISIAIALILMFALTAPLITSVQVVSAQKRSVVGFTAVSPKTIGIGEYVLVIAWISPQPTIIGGVRQVYKDMYVVITKPDGTTVTDGPHTSYIDGTIYFNYTPDKLGKWSAKLTWVGDAVSEGTESKPFEFTVQEEPVPTYPEFPLPTELWTRPINAELRAWSGLAGNWLWNERSSGYNASSAGFNPYSTAPETAHIVWKKPYLQGGIVGGEYEAKRFVSTYWESLYPMIMGGRIYWKWQDDNNCWDLRTGETIWVTPGAFGSRSRNLYCAAGPLVGYDRLEDVYQSQTCAYLWDYNTTHIVKYEAWTGKAVWTLTRPPGVTSFGLTMMDPVNDFAYTAVTANGTSQMIKWKMHEEPTSTMNFTKKIIWQKPCPSIGFMLGGGVVYFGANGQARTAAMDMETGEMLWDITRPYGLVCRGCLADGKAYWPDSTKMVVHAFDLKTGREVWTSEPAEYPWGVFWAYAMGAGYGKVYALNYDGHVYALDSATGKTVWKFYSGDALRRETPYNTWPFFSNPAIADGKLYVSTSEHTPGDPMLRDTKLYCINAETGDEIWKISWSGGAKAIADGSLLACNEADVSMYNFDKGPSATTIAASPKISVQGSSILVEGMVTDESPSTKDYDRLARFPNGVPAIADKDMSPWMEYVYMQKPHPTNATGVEVILTVLDPNNNNHEVGRTTSDADGFFKLAFTPDIPGEYTVTASFAGSESYYGSYAKTALNVEEAPADSAELPVVSTSMADLYFVPSVIGIIIAIAVATVIIVLTFRKRP